MTDSTGVPDQPPHETAAAAPSPGPASAEDVVDAAQVVVTVAADRMSAHLTVVPPPPTGRAVTREDIVAALQAAGVVSGLQQHAIDAVVLAGQADTVLVAQGAPPVDGDDATFDVLVAEIKHRAPKVDERGTVDFRDLGLFFSVKAGSALMRRTAATPGIAGYNVLGETVPAQPGKDTPYAPLMRGAVVDPRNPNLLVAAITGQPVLITHGVVVEPTLTLQAVDLSTGHIEFEGSVNVVGDVKAGMKIHAAGDVTIGGVVEAADIQAKGDVTIKGGVIGHSEWSDAAAAKGDTAHIVSGGSVHTLFAENASIEAAGCIFVHQAARQSHLSAINKVVVGKEDASRGHIIGGRTQATLLVQAAVVGSAAGVRTLLEVGVNPMILHKLEALEARLVQLAKEQADIARLLTFARANPQRLAADVLQKAERTAANLQQELASCLAEQQVLGSQMSLADDARCVIGQKVFGGARVRIGDQSCDIDDERGRGVIRLSEGKLCFGSA